MLMSNAPSPASLALLLRQAGHAVSRHFPKKTHTKMGTAQQFSLRWNNYSTHITNALDDLRAEDELTDVTLCAEGNKIRAHKVLLSACSTFFRETFRENPCQHPVIILKGVNFTDLQAVVTFMYNGQVNVTQERLPAFLQTAEMLQIKGLTDMNEKNEKDDGPPPPLTNNSLKKRVINSGAAMSDQTVQRPPTPKRRKFIPAQGRSNAGSAYNSPGPSSAAGGGGGGVDGSAHTITQSDANSAEAEEYPGDAAALLNYDEQEGVVGGGGGEEEEDEYGNHLSEEGDNSMLDLSGMEQGAIGLMGWMEEGDEFRIGMTNTGSQVLMHQGFLYQIERTQGTKVYWRCRNRRDKCRGRAIKIGPYIQLTQQHNVCIPSPSSV